MSVDFIEAVLIRFSFTDLRSAAVSVVIFMSVGASLSVFLKSEWICKVTGGEGIVVTIVNELR